MIGRRIRLILRIAGYVVGAFIVLFAIALITLRVTNPGPRKAARWVSVADMPHGRGELAAALVGSRMVVAGGLYGIGRTSDEVHVYDINRNEWTRTRPLPAPRHHAAAASVGEYVFLAGGAPGATDRTPTTTLWRAQPGLPWRARAPMPEGRQGHAMVALGDRLYVVGGVGRTDDTLVYDAKSDSWSTAAPIPTGRDHLRAVVWNNEIWALGGREGKTLPTVDIYDPRRDRWRTGPALPQPMSAMAVGVLDDDLHVVGGEDPRFVLGRVIDEHFVLGEGAKRWRKAAKPILPVHGAAFVVHRDRLLVAGGAGREGLLSTISWTPVMQAFRAQGFPQQAH